MSQFNGTVYSRTSKVLQDKAFQYLDHYKIFGSIISMAESVDQSKMGPFANQNSQNN